MSRVREITILNQIIIINTDQIQAFTCDLVTAMQVQSAINRQVNQALTHFILPSISMRSIVLIV
jgi:hypothetical protein